MTQMEQLTILTAKGMAIMLAWSDMHGEKQLRDEIERIIREVEREEREQNRVVDTTKGVLPYEEGMAAQWAWEEAMTHE